MKKYDRDDIVTLYVITFDDGRHKSVQAWTDDKQMAKSYLEFHSSRRMKLRVVKRQMREMVDLINDNRNDEIAICNLTVHNDEEHKKGKEAKIIQVPMTTTEMTMVNDETVSFMASRINYSRINDYLPYLRPKYRKILAATFLDKVINKVLHEVNSEFTDSVALDDLIVLFRNYSEYFD